MKKKNIKGFTLTEMIVVIAIIGILAGVLIPTITGYIKRSKQSAALQEAQAVIDIYDSYKVSLSTDNSLKGNKFGNYYAETTGAILQNELYITYTDINKNESYDEGEENTYYYVASNEIVVAIDKESGKAEYLKELPETGLTQINNFIELVFTFYDKYNDTQNRLYSPKKSSSFGDEYQLKGELIVEIRKEYNEVLFNLDPQMSLDVTTNGNEITYTYIFTSEDGVVVGKGTVTASISLYNQNYFDGCTFEEFYSNMAYSESDIKNNGTLTVLGKELNRLYNNLKDNGNTKVIIK